MARRHSRRAHGKCRVRPLRRPPSRRPGQRLQEGRHRLELPPHRRCQEAEGDGAQPRDGQELRQQPHHRRPAGPVLWAAARGTAFVRVCRANCVFSPPAYSQSPTKTRTKTCLDHGKFPPGWVKSLLQQKRGRSPEGIIEGRNLHATGVSLFLFSRLFSFFCGFSNFKCGQPHPVGRVPVWAGMQGTQI